MPSGAQQSAGETLDGSLATFSLARLAEEAAAADGEAWGEDPGLSLLLDESLKHLRQEMLALPAALARYASSENSAPIRSRIWAFFGKFSIAYELFDQLVEVAQHADIWVFGLPDINLPIVDNIVAVPLHPGMPLARERGIVVEGTSMCAVLLASEAGQLTAGDSATHYCEGMVSAQPAIAEEAAARLAALVGVDPLPRHTEVELALSWQGRLGMRMMDALEASRLKLHAREGEMAAAADESRRLQEIVRSYIGGQTWREVTEAVESGQTSVIDRREELTVCFCDLVGFTQISERLQPAEVAAILNDHYSTLSEIVRSHGGWIDKFIGDAMLAVFDRPLEAMQASQKMVRETRFVRVTDQMTQNVQVRVGLNTGVVAVANLGTLERRERTVLGDAVNIAQRLQSVAHPQSVLVSARTVSRLPYSIARTLEQLEVTVKGKRDPLVAYRWTIHGDRRAPDQQIELRENISNATRSTPLYERLRGLQTQADRKVHGRPEGD
jgi:class 3 adenylate cyclase